MALVTKENRKLQHPTEDDAWFVVRLPLSVGDLKKMRTDEGGVVMSLDLATELIKEWSYPDPLTTENIERLDIDTFQWLSKEISAASGIRGELEKKESSDSSSPTSAPAKGSSPKSSGT